MEILITVAEVMRMIAQAYKRYAGIFLIEDHTHNDRFFPQDCEGLLIKS